MSQVLNIAVLANSTEDAEESHLNRVRISLLVEKGD